MKKLLTILLALLVVTGVVFAAEDSTLTFLTLSATKAVVLEQGIATSVTTSGVVLPVDTVNAATKTVKLESGWSSATDISEAWGTPIYYTILTNSKDLVTVTVDITPLTLVTESATKYYVPYILSIGSSDFVFDSGSQPGITAIDGVIGTSLNLTNDVNWGSKTSMRYFNGAIDVSIVGNPEDAMEGSYAATVTFNVTNGS